MFILAHYFIPLRTGFASGRTRHTLSAPAGKRFPGEKQAQAHRQATSQHDNQCSNESYH
jgi:hypothetical protein